jgi:siderophore synthetase component
VNALWQKVNREMVAKILAELEYERTLRAEPVSSDGWRITMGNGVLAVSRHARDLGLAAYRS